MALLVATATACTASRVVTSGSGANPNPSHAQLVAVADLSPCPKSSLTVVSGGLPNVTLPCLGSGPAVHLSGLIGKPTVVNIWGSWCGPCQSEMTYLSSVYDEDRGQVRFLGVDTVDNADSALDFDAHVTPPVHFPSVFDEDRKVLIDGHLPPSPPVTLFVSATGKLVHTEHSAYKSARQLQADIATYLLVPA